MSKFSAFTLPKMSITERFDYDREVILNELEEAPHILSFYRTKQGDAQCLFTDLGEGEFKLLISEVHRHVALYDFVKSAIITIDKAREEGGDMQALMLEAIRYIKLKHNPIQNLKTHKQ